MAEEELGRRTCCESTIWSGTACSVKERRRRGTYFTSRASRAVTRASVSGSTSHSLRRSPKCCQPMRSNWRRLSRVGPSNSPVKGQNSASAMRWIARPEITCLAAGFAGMWASTGTCKSTMYGPFRLRMRAFRDNAVAQLASSRWCGNSTASVGACCMRLSSGCHAALRFSSRCFLSSMTANNIRAIMCCRWRPPIEPRRMYSSMKELNKSSRKQPAMVKPSSRQAISFGV